MLVNTTSRFLGIDPGLTCTGWAIIDLINNGKFQYIDSGVIKTSVNTNNHARLNFIFQECCKVLTSYRPNYAAIEETYVNNNGKSSIVLAQAKAASIIAITQNSIPIGEYPAKRIKKTISGSGNADKEQVLKMIGYWLENISISLFDESDAIAIALCHASHFKEI